MNKVYETQNRRSWPIVWMIIALIIAVSIVLAAPGLGTTKNVNLNTVKEVHDYHIIDAEVADENSVYVTWTANFTDKKMIQDSFYISIEEYQDTATLEKTLRDNVEREVNAEYKNKTKQEPSGFKDYKTINYLVN